MLARIKSRLTYANVMASVAVFVALGGSAYAVSSLPANSVGTKQLKDAAVTTPKLANAAVGKLKLKAGAVTGAKVADGTLTGADVRSSTLGVVPNATHAGSADTVPDGSIGPSKSRFTSVGEVASTQTTNSTFFTDLATVGPSATVSVPPGAIVLVHASAVMKTSDAASPARVEIVRNQQCPTSGGSLFTDSRLRSASTSAEKRVTVPGSTVGATATSTLTGGVLVDLGDAAATCTSTYKLEYKVDSASATATFSDRLIAVTVLH